MAVGGTGSAIAPRMLDAHSSINTIRLNIHAPARISRSLTRSLHHL
jgi:hypothetical protein